MRFPSFTFRSQEWTARAYTALEELVVTSNSAGPFNWGAQVTIPIKGWDECREAFVFFDHASKNNWTLIKVLDKIHEKEVLIEKFHLE